MTKKSKAGSSHEIGSMVKSALVIGISVVIVLGLGLGIGFSLKSVDNDFTTLEPTTLEPTTLEPRSTTTIPPMEQYCPSLFKNCEICKISDKYNNKAIIECDTCYSGFYELNGCFRQCNQEIYKDWQVTCETNSTIDFECKFALPDGSCLEFSRIFNSNYQYDDGYSVGTRLDFKYKNISSYNSRAFDGADKRGVTRIDMAENRLTSLTDYAFSGFDRVTSLVFFLNNITHISEHSFHGLDRLKVIFLYKNNIKTLSGTPFQGLNQLVSLPLYTNDISSVGENVFSGLKNLKIIYLQENKINGTLPETVFDDLESLEALALDHNEMNVIPKRLFENLYSITAIDLSYNNCTVDPYLCFGWHRSNYQSLKECHCD